MFYTCSVNFLQYYSGMGNPDTGRLGRGEGKASLTSRRTCTYVLVTEKNLHGTLKLHLRFYNRI